MDQNKKKLLLVEDDKDIKDFYSDFLSHDYLIETAGDGEEGLIKAKSGKPDLILLDIMMPKLDGMGFLKAQKEDKSIALIPVVILTNLGQAEVLKACFELGVKYYILKAEITPDQILPVLTEALQSKQIK